MRLTRSAYYLFDAAQIQRPQIGEHVSRKRREHSASEFGREPTSGSSMAGLDGPMIGAASSIMVDALVEQESGKTPPPPPVSVRALAIAIGAMFLFGLLLLLFVTQVLHLPL